MRQVDRKPAKRIALVVFPGFQVLDMVALSVFEMANLALPRPLYELQVVSEQGGPVKSSCGAQVQSRPFSRSGYDTVIVAGATEVQPSAPRLLQLLATAEPRTRRMTSICTGAFVLAEAGLLEGRRVTTHWHHAREFQRRHPEVRLEEDRIFVRDGHVWTSAGMTACIDLALALVEADAGAEVSRQVARKLVVHHRRTGGQSQFSAVSELEASSDRIQAALTYARNHLREELAVETLADIAHLSPRQFSRAFLRETGETPARAIERLRADMARQLVEAGQSTIERIADQTGFGNAERMRRAFLRCYGQSPQALKRAARERKAEEGVIAELA